MKKEALRIYGVSHIVFSTHDMEEIRNLFDGVEYYLKDKKKFSLNPNEKETFMSHAMAETSNMMLLAHDIFPDIEIKKENGIYSTRSKSRYNFYIDYNSSVVSDYQELKNFHGLESINNNSFNLFIQCDNIIGVISFWKLFGISVIKLSGDLYLCVIRNVFSKKQINILYYRVSKCIPAWLDQSGVVCLSLLCADVVHTQKYLIKMQYSVGDVFEISPFGKKLKAFFMKSNSGDLYEFVSPA